MTTDIEQFQFPVTGQAVRTAIVNGETMFFAADVCAVLGHTEASKIVRGRLDADEYVTVDVPHGTTVDSDISTTNRALNPMRLVVSESGLFSLILWSHKPEAKAFRKWVTAEVLPAIRRTGSYSVAALPDLTTAEGVLAMAERFAQTARDLVESEQARREMEPKAVAYDAFLSAGAGDRLVRQAAKELGLKEMDLRRFLLDQKLIFCREAPCGAKQYEPYAANAKHFKPVEKVVEHTWGTCAHFTLYIRPSGMDLVHRRLVAENSRYQAAIAATAQKGL